MIIEQGAFEVVYNEPDRPAGLYRAGFKVGHILQIDGHWFVSGSEDAHCDFVGTSGISLELAFEQFLAIKNLLQGSVVR